MNYIPEYEICALVFLIIVTVRFFSMRKFNSKPNRVFGTIMHCAIINITLDIISAYLIDNVNTVPVWLNYTINSMFFSLQVALPMLMFIYVIALSGCEIPKAAFYGALIPAAIDEVFIILNPFTHLVFYFGKTPDGLVYKHGVLLNLLYAVSVLYMLLTLTSVFHMRRYFRKIDVRTITGFVLLIAAAMTVQIIFPRLLLTGVAMSVAIFMMFITMQNPETMLDSITGTFNYSAMTDFLRRQISDGNSMWIAAVDVGGIRRVNSMMGIRIGNELLEKVGKYISDSCGTHATAFRMIGTRFIIISDNEMTHRSLVSQITGRFKNPWTYNGGTGIRLLATVRYCEQKYSFSSPEDVVNLIDLAYSKTAEEGFGTTFPIDEKQLEQFRRKGQIKEALERAVISGEGFYLNYQPLYSVKEKKLCGAEALLRFSDPVLGQISPAEFIPIAEGTELIYQIDRIVIGMACDFLRKNPVIFDSGLRLLQINLSATEFNRDTESLLNDISAEITGLENRICFEVTETAVISRREVLADFMQCLIDRGVRFAVDDFGTGYANITQLAKLPFSIVKLDRVFVTQNYGREAMILRDLVNMFDHIGMSTVFEGVETQEQAEFASGLGVDQIQGFYYSRPLSDGDLLERMGKEYGTAI